jgi:phytanoyl-CoA dioxygenase PhyH
MATEQQITLSKTDVLTIDFWTKLAPHLSIGCNRPPQISLTKEQENNLATEIVREGYIHLVQPGFQIQFAEIAKLFNDIVSLNLPPVFAFVYDELWMIQSHLSKLIEVLLEHKAALLPDFWAWRVMPGEAGWKPHRDKIAGSLFQDKRPKSLTVWVPITKAHPLNSCMYVLPAGQDEEYALENSVKGVGSLHDMRALPAEAGDVLIWTQHLFHWGSRAADSHNLPPRMSVAFEYQRLDVQPFRKPLLSVEEPLSFEERLALIGKQIMQYRHMYASNSFLNDLANEITKFIPFHGE